MLNPTGMKSVYTRKTSSNKDNLVTFANAVKTVGSNKPTRLPVSLTDWKLSTPRGSAWVHETNNSDWDVNVHTMNKFHSQRNVYWHSHHQSWEHKTTHADALKSDAYWQHSLQIKSNDKGWTPLPEEIKTLYNQKKVNKPSIKYNKKLIYNTEEKPFTMHKIKELSKVITPTMVVGGISFHWLEPKSKQQEQYLQVLKIKK